MTKPLGLPYAAMLARRVATAKRAARTRERLSLMRLSAVKPHRPFGWDDPARFQSAIPRDDARPSLGDAWQVKRCAGPVGHRPTGWDIPSDESGRGQRNGRNPA